MPGSETVISGETLLDALGWNEREERAGYARVARDMPAYELSRGTPGRPTLYERNTLDELLRFLGVSGWTHLAAAGA
jgi:hypothetical protein